MTASIGYTNRIDTATLSGGSWGTTLLNLQNRYLKNRAVSAGVTLAATVINLDLGAAVNVGVIALVNHTLSTSAMLRIEGHSASSWTTATVDTGWIKAYAATDLAIALNLSALRYWRLSIDDQTNPAGSIQIGRIFIGERFTPANNADFGLSLTRECDTQVSRAIGGPEYFEERPTRRVITGKFSWLNATEEATFGTLQTASGLSRECYFLQDAELVGVRPNTSTYTQASPRILTTASTQTTRAYLARFKQLDAIEYPYVGTYTAAISFSELL